ncbi:MAG: PD40 domain-containing protein [Bacteroidetes bacterium]|nr:PD40 domain-containing protein [Bacteroidota bacterium]
MHTTLKSLLFALAAIIITSFKADEGGDKPPKWDVSNPVGNWEWKTHEFTTDEGTWMNLDVSPDGKTIVFDMMGDIYKIPISGGKATPLRTGIPFEIQPRFSPDGQYISFTSDAGGGDNIWVMKADGSDAKQITTESFRLINNAIWKDEHYLIARKHFTSERSLGAGEMWMYHITGGSGLQLTKRKNDQQDVNEPCLSPDKKWLYYSEDMYPGGYFQYNKDPNDQIYVINRYNLETGKTERVTGGPGGAARPQISPDGKLLAFVKRVRTKSVLYIHNLETGQEYPVYDKLNKDQMEAWCLFGVYTNFNWLPDNDHVVFWAGGKINKLNIKTLESSIIPFEADVKVQINKALEFENPAFTENFNPKVIRQAITSPNGKQVVFNAVGYLWSKKLPDGKPKRLTNSTDFEFEPSFSPDGKHIVYVSWNDENLGEIRVCPSTGGKWTTYTSGKGIYRTPSFGPDNRIVYRKEGGNNEQGHAYSKNPGIYIMNPDGTNPQLVSKSGEYPVFSQDGKRIFFQTGGDYYGNLTKQYQSMDLHGHDVRTHISSKYANRFVLSPDNKWVAFQHLHKVYLAPLPETGQTIDLNDKTNSLPVQQVAKDAGINIHWSPESDKVMWTLGNQYFSTDLKERFTFLDGADQEVAPLSEKGIEMGLELKCDKPKGITVLKGARIITMEGDLVIKNGEIEITDNRITAIGPSGTVQVGANAKVIDVTGKTIMPGMVDVHAHIGAFRYGLTTQKHWQFYANLAYGVTTAHDPSANTETVFALSELQKAGELVGPRLFSTGFILYGAEADVKAVVNNLEDARSSIRRTKAFGALSVKSYNQPRRDQRQQVIQAAKEENIFVVPEGGSTFFHNMTMIMDGHTGVEHNIPVAPVYKDIIELWSASNTGYTPTLIVNYGGLNAEYYWYQNTNVWENEKLLKYYPREIIDSRSRHRTMVPQEEYDNGHILVSQSCKKLADAGVKVNLGAHGQLQGLGAHWELWSLQQGGMTNLEALKAATINGADYIGMSADIGSLKKGKLADLIIMDQNPLDDIRNTESITHVMINGRLYDTETMNEVGNHPKERGKFYWEVNGYNAAFPWHEETKSAMRPGCSCQTGHP